MADAPGWRCPALIKFLVDAFGFEETAVYGEGDRVHHNELAWPPGGGIMLGSVRDTDAWPLRPGGFGAYVLTDDPDAWFARATAARLCPDQTRAGSRPDTEPS